jgi:hypothetical protein
MSVPTRTLLRVHRYAGLAAAPLVLFFAVSGVWQTYRLHQQWKNASYTPPALLVAASRAHKAEKVATGVAGWAFKVFVTGAASLLTLTTLLGIVVALRVTRPRWLAVLLLVVGGALPALLFLVAAG